MGVPVTNLPRVLPGLLERTGSLAKAAQAAPVGPSFAERLGQVLDDTNDTQKVAEQMQQALLNGEPVELHQVMIKAEEAGLAMDLLLELRNKLIDAYKDVIRMPL
ncbi:MAG: flagellar hook-basal body complex protein FliE [bacterium]